MRATSKVTNELQQTLDSGSVLPDAKRLGSEDGLLRSRAASAPRAVGRAEIIRRPTRAPTTLPPAGGRRHGEIDGGDGKPGGSRPSSGDPGWYRPRESVTGPHRRDAGDGSRPALLSTSIHVRDRAAHPLSGPGTVRSSGRADELRVDPRVRHRPGPCPARQCSTGGSPRGHRCNARDRAPRQACLSAHLVQAHGHGAQH